MEISDILLQLGIQASKRSKCVTEERKTEKYENSNIMQM